MGLLDVVGHVAGVTLALHASPHLLLVTEAPYIAALRAVSNIDVVEAVLASSLVKLSLLAAVLAVDLVQDGALPAVVLNVLVTGATQTRGCSVARGPRPGIVPVKQLLHSHAGALHIADPLP